MKKNEVRKRSSQSESNSSEDDPRKYQCLDAQENAHLVPQTFRYSFLLRLITQSFVTPGKSGPRREVFIDHLMKLPCVGGSGNFSDKVLREEVDTMVLAVSIFLLFLSILQNE